MKKNNDVIFLGVSDMKSLKKLASLEGSLKSNGMIWVVWPKGQKQLSGNDVRNKALEVGLVDVKVCSFSESLNALKMMIPKARR
ncbi:MAG: hypothetical protein O7G85_09970 [Planctomycetota bacterium]|nr:hypothetical protein [Planctomycetota bacterium]